MNSSENLLRNPQTLNNSADRAQVLWIETEVFFRRMSGSNRVAHQLPISERNKDGIARLEARNGQVRVDSVRATSAWVERNINYLDLRAHGLEFGSSERIAG
jgi:hypothetical protein